MDAWCQIMTFYFSRLKRENKETFTEEQTRSALFTWPWLSPSLMGIWNAVIKAQYGKLRLPCLRLNSDTESGTKAFWCLSTILRHCLEEDMREGMPFMTASCHLLNRERSLPLLLVNSTLSESPASLASTRWAKATISPLLTSSLSKPPTPMLLQHQSHYCLDSFPLSYIEEAS